MPALVAGIHVVPTANRLRLWNDVDDRDKPGHDEVESGYYLSGATTMFTNPPGRSLMSASA